MNNVHRLVVPRRDEPQDASATAVRHRGEVLILPCVRYERMDAPAGRKPSSVLAHDPLRQDLTA